MLGFTLLELIAVVALVAILLTIGVPTFREIQRNSHLITQVNQIILALNLARSEAIKRAARITICKSNDEINCSTTASWSDGWIVFTDTATIGSLDGSDTLIRAWSRLKQGFSLTAGVNFTNYVSYLASGESRGSPDNNDTFTLCDDETKKGRQIIINPAGHFRVGDYICP